MEQMMIQNLINEFSVDNLKYYFRHNIRTFKKDEKDYSHLFNREITEQYENIHKIGEAKLNNIEDLIIIVAKTRAHLTDRSSKKRQFEIAKKILKNENRDASFFVFYDESENFRFSFISANYLGVRRDFTNFRRYTYFVSTDQTNRTFINQISSCNFYNIDEILKAFSVEPLNKEFYLQIADAFYNLIGGNVSIGNRIKVYKNILQLPSKNIETDRKTFQEFAVRLIGRIVFVWFLKNKTSENGVSLIPKDWLSSKKVKNSKNFYHNYLEKLFFEILNEPIEQRIADLPQKHEIIPFLNGGLFEPQVDDFYKTGFGGFSKYNNILNIPDEWILKLFETLEQFNFTIDENSLNDQEVSIDPEMLGTIFENLLAEIDPDTEKSARKSTGSFYTPREIVDYMVEESLVAYLKNKTNIEEEPLHILFKENDLPADCFSDIEKGLLINAFDEIKILDPACGSGAFPMGALHKINTALQKLDPDAEIWKEKQLAKINDTVYRKALKDKLDKSNVEYIRKLGIIQHSIYGVDIQPIAIEISKLRAFLSLVIDENVNDDVKNRGILPLPNLEFKFVTANTLIGLEQDNKQESLDFSKASKNIEELQRIRNNNLQNYGELRERLKQDFLNLQNEITKNEFKICVSGINKRTQQIITWNPFNNEKSNWFDPKWMFGVENFDIVIGNPPYISIRTNSFNSSFKKIYKEKFQLALGQFDLFILFIEKSVNILKEQGVLSFIIPTCFLSNENFQNARIFLYNNCRIVNYLNAKMPFESANVEANAFIGIKNNYSENVSTYIYDLRIKNISKLSTINYNLIHILPFSIFPFIVKQNEIDLINKILNTNNHHNLGKFLSITRGFEFGYNHKSITTVKNNFPLIKSESIYRYTINEEQKLYVKVDFSDKSTFKTKNTFKKTPKLLTRFISNKIIFAIDKIGFVNTNVVYNCHLIDNNENINYNKLLGWLNSKLVSFWFKITFLNLDTLFPHIQKNQLTSIIIPTNNFCWDKLEMLVIKIMTKKKQGENTAAEELKIDLMAYKLYNLTYEEVKIIDPEFNISKKEYENYKNE
jgi:hypothetical protein